MNSLKLCKHGMMIYNTRDIWVGRSLSLYGEFSEHEVTLFKEVVNVGDVVMDIGANIGTHTLAFSKIVGPTGRVVAFEPERTNFTALAGNIAINNILNTYVNQIAVGDKSGFISVPELDHDKTFNYGGIELKNDYSKNFNYKVQMLALDDAAFEKIDFIKIDVEGMELEVLSGGKGLLNKLYPILYVENDRVENSEKLVEFIKSNDYKIYQHDTTLYNDNNFEGNSVNVLVMQKESGDVVPVISRNLLCIHKSRDIQLDTTKHGLIQI